MSKSRRAWFLRFLGRAIKERRGRVMVAALSVTIAVGIIVSALGVSMGIRAKLGGELKAYGANVIVSMPGGYLKDNAELSGALLPELGVESYAKQLYAVVEVSHPAAAASAAVSNTTSGASVELMGMELAKLSSLRVQGAMPAADKDEIEALVGVNIADALGLKGGETIRADFGDGVVPLLVSGLVETGGPEDSAVIMDIKRAAALVGLQGKVSAVLVRADTLRFQEAVSNMQRLIEGAEIKTLKQVARAEQNFLAKIELLMALVAVVVLVASSISVSSTMSATVLERLVEIGLMKAIGGTRAEIGAFFMAEGLFIGIVGGAMGYVMGYAAAQVVSKGAFGSFIPVPLYLLFGGIAAGALLSVLASLWPLLGALRYKPSIILRGE